MVRRKSFWAKIASPVTTTPSPADPWPLAPQPINRACLESEPPPLASPILASKHQQTLLSG